MWQRDGRARQEVKERVVGGEWDGDKGNGNDNGSDVGGVEEVDEAGEGEGKGTGAVSRFFGVSVLTTEVMYAVGYSGLYRTDGYHTSSRRNPLPLPLLLQIPPQHYRFDGLIFSPLFPRITEILTNEAISENQVNILMRLASQPGYPGGKCQR